MVRLFYANRASAVQRARTAHTACEAPSDAILPWFCATNDFLNSKPAMVFSVRLEVTNYILLHDAISVLSHTPYFQP